MCTMDLHAMVGAYVRGDDKQGNLRVLKSEARRSALGINLVYEAIRNELKASSSAVRLHAMELCNEFFMRSKEFRTLLADELPDLVGSVVPGDPEALPPPRDAARQIKKEFQEYLRAWCKKFGDHYAQLQIAHEYLSNIWQLAPTLESRATTSQPMNADQLVEIGRDASGSSQGPDGSAMEHAQRNMDAAQSCLQCVHVLLDLLGHTQPIDPGVLKPSCQEVCTTEHDGVNSSANELLRVPVAIVTDGEGGAASREAIKSGSPEQTNEVELHYEDVSTVGFGNDSNEGHGFDIAEDTASQNGLWQGCWRLGDGATRRALEQTLSEAHRVLQRRHIPRLQEVERIMAQQSHRDVGGEQQGRNPATTRSADLRCAAVAACARIAEVCGDVALSNMRVRWPARGGMCIDRHNGMFCFWKPVVRCLRGRNERIWPEGPASCGRRAEQGRDPAAANLEDPYTIVSRPAGSRKVARRACAESGGRPRSGEPVSLNGPLKCAEPSTIEPSALQDILKKAPLLPSGDYLQLWESQESQMDFVRRHATAGQIYSHWGRNDADASLDPKAVADLLALRPIYAGDRVSRESQKQATEGVQATLEPRGAQKLSAPKADSGAGTLHKSHGEALLTVNCVTNDHCEVRQAERAYTQAVLARAGERELEGSQGRRQADRPARGSVRKRSVQQLLLQSMKRRR